MNNHLGCSTLGFTQDNKLLIWIQGNSNQFNNGLLMPTASGSCNATDIVGKDFQKTIINAMERELKEECIPEKKLNQQYETLILGFFRWVSRGGKPEFVGITKLPGLADEYKPNNKEVGTNKIMSSQFTLSSIDKLPAITEELKKYGMLSVPLFMCLYELNYMYKNYKEELNNFLFGINPLDLNSLNKVL